MSCLSQRDITSQPIIVSSDLCGWDNTALADEMVLQARSVITSRLSGIADERSLRPRSGPFTRRDLRACGARGSGRLSSVPTGFICRSSPLNDRARARNHKGLANGLRAARHFPPNAEDDVFGATTVDIVGVGDPRVVIAPNDHEANRRAKDDKGLRWPFRRGAYSPRSVSPPTMSWSIVDRGNPGLGAGMCRPSGSATAFYSLNVGCRLERTLAMSSGVSATHPRLHPCQETSCVQGSAPPRSLAVWQDCHP